MIEDQEGNQQVPDYHVTQSRTEHGSTPMPKHSDPANLLQASATSQNEASRQLALPARKNLDLMLRQSEDGDSLVKLEKAAATLLEFAKRQERLKERLFEVTEWHLRVKRKLGIILSQTVSRGGDRAKSRAATLPPGRLPSGIDKHAAKRCRRLAHIEDVVFESYLKRAAIQSRAPSAAGAIAFSEHVGSPCTRSPRRKLKAHKNSPSRTDVQASPGILDAIARCLGDIDVCVGDVDIQCHRRVAGPDVCPTDMNGTVLISWRLNPTEWIAKLSDLRRDARIDQAVVLLPAETSSSWFRHFSGAPWHLCFLGGEREPVVAAYIGSRTEGFLASIHEHGLVVKVCN